FSAFLIGGLLCYLLIPLFGKLAQEEIYTALIDTRKVILFLIISFFSILILISIIPVLIFTNISPQQIKANKFSLGKSTTLSQVFVSFQYCISIILIVVTMFGVRQAKFLKQKSLGFSTENIIDIDMGRIPNNDRAVFRDKLLKHPGVESIALSSRNFMNGSSDGYARNKDGEQITTMMFKVDPGYIPTLGLNLLQGKNFTEKDISPSAECMIVNEAFVKAMGVEKDPLGQNFKLWGQNLQIVGVVQDYHFRDMRNKIHPAMLYTRQRMGNQYSRALVKCTPMQINDVVKHIKKTYKQMAPGKTLDYSFWDQQLGRRYQEEERWSKILGYAAIIAIIISSLGLFGLSILLINQRIKEIGIRKATGAKVIEVLGTINKSFVAWLLGALVIAAPISHMIVNKLFEIYAYRVSMNWWVFALAGIGALIVALITVSYHSWRAASRNPVESLRNE
ncbi:ABC transporter permease, partial [Bacteroidales bacterium]|nr:ABC transporter permease [Bacteroidales bacterium]